MTKEEYSSGMLLLRWFHKLEKKLYGVAEWVSHTNKERMTLFSNDMPGINIPMKYILPNYPPKNWKRERNRNIRWPVRFVQVGSLGLDTMYTRQFAEWVLRQEGKAVWDIYALTAEPAAMDYILSLRSSAICFKGKVDYHTLPVVFKKYDVGVILYKGHIPNYIYNAPNKLFEYYVCGLDVWFPGQMITAAEYATIGTFPRVIPIDFERLSLSSLNELVDRQGLAYQQIEYSAETALTPLLNNLDASTAN